MLNNFLDILLIIKYPTIGLFLFFTMISLYWNLIFRFLRLKAYSNIQKVHKNEVPRLGGAIIYFFFWTICFLGFVQDDLFNNLMISSIPFVFIGLKEDLFHNTSPKTRLLFMLISCLIFFFINPINFPTVELPIIGKIISFNLVSIVFFTFSVMVVMNGMNLIDGMNGLLGFTVLFILLAIAFISLNHGDINFIKVLIIFSIPLVIFLFFNFPFGKVFIGDLGAYFYGFITAMVTIYFFGLNQTLNTWTVVLLLFYPCFELLFSFMRKIKNKFNPFKPDDRHLHTLIFKMLNNKYNAKVSNSLATLLLTIFWLVPSTLTIFFYNQINFIILSILVMSFLYCFIYRLLVQYYFKKNK